MLTVPYIPSRQYVGARYLPIIVGDWDINKEYEPLMVVYYNGASYTSKTYIPAGIDISNTEYWALSADYNAQVAAYRAEVIQAISDFNNLKNGIVNDFKSIRLFSGFEDLGSVVCYFVNKYIFVSFSENDFTLNVYDDTFTFLNSYTYNYSIHANAAFTFNNKIYIVDSNNSDLYIINSDFSFNQVITSLENRNIYSGAAYNDHIYVYGTDTLYKLAEDYTVVEAISLTNISITTTGFSPVQQGIIIFNDYIYKIFNRPNIIIKYDFDGNPLNIIDIGIGNGYYPYGEIENFFEKDGKLLMYSGLYSGDANYPASYGQIFETNIDNVIGYNSIYGQQTPAYNNIMYCNKASTSKNPIGTNDKAFNNAFEAGCVFSYLNQIGMGVQSIIFSGDFTNDVLVLSNVIVNNHLFDTSPKFKAIFIINSNVVLTNCRSDYMYIAGSKAALNNYRNDIKFKAIASDLTMNGVKFNGTDLECSVSSFRGVWSDGAALSNVIINDCIINDHDGVVGVEILATDTNIPIDKLTQHAITHGQSSVFTIDIFAGYATHVFVGNITTGQKTALAGGGSKTFYDILVTNDSDGKIVYYPLTFVLTKDSLTIKKSAGVFADGSASANVVYPIATNLRWIERTIS